MAERQNRQERQDRNQSELVDKLVGVRRVAKTTKGGRNMSFTAIVIVGDESGRVGWGGGKAREVPDAVRKATDVAKRAMVRVPLRHGRTLHHEVKGNFGASRVILKPAVPGTGIIAGGPMRAVFEAMGMKDIVAKSLGSNNPYNLIQATFNAFAAMETPRSIASKRGLKITDLSLHRAEVEKGEASAQQAEAKPEPKAKKAAPKKAAAKKAPAKATSAKKEAPKAQATTEAPKAEVKAEAKEAPKVEAKADAKAEKATDKQES